jgi:hypothetical protein
MLLQADGKLPTHSITARDDTCSGMHISASHQEEEEGEGGSQTNLSGKLTRATNRSDLWFASERTQL